VIGAIVQFLLGVMGFFLKKKPATDMDVENQINEVQKASAQAGDTVARATDSGSKLRDYETHDPNNRDNG